MNRKQADVVAGGLVAAIVLIGLVTAVQLFLADTPGMNDGGPVPLMGLFGPVLMSLVFASIVGGIYVFVRGKLFENGGDGDAETPAATDADRDVASGEARAADSDAESTSQTEANGQAGTSGARQLLDVLPDDEERILEPVVESPGLTQIEVRDRSGFSKSKVSQTITDLEGRGLLYRERQGRTYRVYPADDLDERV